MATSKQRFKKIADNIAQTADSFAWEVKETEDKLKATGRDIDDKLDAWADENATAMSERFGTDPHETSGWIKAAVWVGVIVGLIVLGWVGARLL